MAIFKKLKRKIIGGVSDILADYAFGRNKNNKKIKKANQDYNDLRLVREARGTQDRGNYRDPLFRARANVAVLKVEAEAKRKKLKVAKQIKNNPSSYAKDYAKMRSSANK